MKNKAPFLLFKNTVVFTAQKYVFKIIYLIYRFFISSITHCMY